MFVEFIDTIFSNNVLQKKCSCILCFGLRLNSGNKQVFCVFLLPFFTLPPDDKYIEKTISEALYLIDESGMKQRNALLDKGFYSDILSHSANFSIVCDSITIDKNAMTFRYYGKQRIEKKFSLTIRELVTTGGLRLIPRTENNPFGYIIVDYRTISNKDISEERKY